MTVEESDTIDIYAFGEDGVLRLYISDHLPWGDDEHLFLLQEKLNAYMAYVETGQHVRELPAARDAPVAIEVVAQHDPDAAARDFLFRAGEVVARAGIALSWSERRS